MDTYKMVTDSIIALLEQGTIPWTKPWASTESCAWSGATGRPYSFINQMLLLIHSESKTTEEIRGEWLTFHQVEERGGRVRKGEHGKKVVFFKPLAIKPKTEDEEEKTIPLLKAYTVFHINQCEGITQKFHTDDEHYDFSPIEQAEKISEDYIARSGLTVRHVSGDRACYSPDTDTVTMPLREQFKIVPEYYSTLFHEYTHSTGHKTRLDRKLSGVLGGMESYSTEELVAEIGSASILASLGIDTTGSLRNSAGYIQGWLKALRDDKKMIVVAASRAEKAVRLILGVDTLDTP